MCDVILSEAQNFIAEFGIYPYWIVIIEFNGKLIIYSYAEIGI